MVMNKRVEEMVKNIKYTELYKIKFKLKAVILYDFRVAFTG